MLSPDPPAHGPSLPRKTISKHSRSVRKQMFSQRVTYWRTSCCVSFFPLNCKWIFSKQKLLDVFLSLASRVVGCKPSAGCVKVHSVLPTRGLAWWEGVHETLGSQNSKYYSDTNRSYQDGCFLKWISLFKSVFTNVNPTYPSFNASLLGIANQFVGKLQSRN